MRCLPITSKTKASVSARQLPPHALATLRDFLRIRGTSEASPPGGESGGELFCQLLLQSGRDFCSQGMAHYLPFRTCEGRALRCVSHYRPHLDDLCLGELYETLPDQVREPHRSNGNHHKGAEPAARAAYELRHTDSAILDSAEGEFLAGPHPRVAQVAGEATCQRPRLTGHAGFDLRTAV